MRTNIPFTVYVYFIKCGDVTLVHPWELKGMQSFKKTVRLDLIDIHFYIHVYSQRDRETYQ